MDFQFSIAIPILERTPRTLSALLDGLPNDLTQVSEGPGTWTVHEVLAHLIHGEDDDWIPRVHHILQWGDSKAFSPFDRTFGFEEARRRPVRDLLDEFAQRRSESLVALEALHLTTADLARPGRHPEFGAVTLGQHLATWVAHDLTHVSQIVRILAVHYREAVGPWAAFLRVVRPIS